MKILQKFKKSFSMMAIFALAMQVMFLGATPMFAAVTNTGFVMPTINANFGWTSPEHAYDASNSTWASVGSGSKSVEYRNFGFAGLTGATINGIEVQVTGYVNGGSRQADLNMSSDMGGSYTATAKTTDLPTNTTASGETTRTFGGAADTWGRTWAPGDFSNTNFRLWLLSTSGGGTLYVNKVSVKIYYTAPITTYTLTYTPGLGGTISGTSPQTVNSGTNGTEVTALADPGYHFVSWSDGRLTANRMDTNVVTNKSLTANFAVDTFTISASAGPGGTITPLGDTVVSYDSNSPAYSITPDPGYHIVDVLVNGSSVGSVDAYQFFGVQSDYSISTTFAIDRFVIASSAGANGTISPTPSVTLDSGANQQFVMTPAAGYHVANVVIDTVNQGPMNDYTFTNVTSAHTISVTFAINTSLITASSGTGGTVTPDGATSVNYGGNQSYTIAPELGYHIVDVLVDDVSKGPIETYDFTNVTAPHTISATFAIDTFTISASAGAGGSITPSGDASVNYGADSAVYNIAPATGYHVADILVDGVSIGVETSYQFLSVQDNRTISATFAIDQFNIDSSAGSHGSIDPKGTTVVDYGNSQKYVFTPETGYHVATVVVDETTLPNPVNDYTFTSVQRAHSISVTFAIDTNLITATAGSNGTIAPVGDTSVNYGGSQSYVITPDKGYVIADVLVDGVSQGAVATYQFTEVTVAHTIAASFKLGTFNATFEVDGVQAVVPTLYGAVIAPPASPTKAGFTFAGWSPAVPATMPAENLVFTALWSANPVVDNNPGNVLTPVAPVVVAAVNASGSGDQAVQGSSTDPKTTVDEPEQQAVQGATDDNNDDQDQIQKFLNYQFLGLSTWVWLLLIAMGLLAWWYFGFKRKPEVK